MKKEKFFGFIFLLFFAAGCATTQQSSLLNQLQIQVAQLERKVEEKNQQINDFEFRLEELTAQMENFKTGQIVSSQASPEDSSGQKSVSQPTSGIDSNAQGVIRVNASTQDIQSALKIAGYYQGELDGKIGSQTRKAIEDFQRDKGLQTDGIVGEKTWMELKVFLSSS